MDITKESTGELTATVKIKLTEEDYSNQVKNTLKDYQRKAQMPGFRPGKVPFGLVKKMYGKAVIADEVNKLLSESITNYLIDEKIDTLGNPLPNEESQPEIDFENDTEFEFHFDIGIKPEIDIEINDSITIDYFKIKVDDETENKYVDDICKRQGKQVEAEQVSENDIIYGNITEKTDAEEKISKENAPVSVDFIKDEKIKEQFLSAKLNDIITFDPVKAFDNETEVSSLLGIDKEKVKELGDEFEFEIVKITHMEPAELNEDLFKTVYPMDSPQNEEEFRQKIREEVEKMYANESDRKLLHDTVDKLIEETNLNLPDEFMKRWIKYNNEREEAEKQISQEELDTQYESYRDSLRWQLIENKIIKDHDIKVEQTEIRQRFKEMYGIMTPGEEAPQLKELIDNMMKNEEYTRKVNEELYDKKLTDLFKEKLKLKEKNISYDDFVKLVTEKQNKK
jgi:trigger factor